MTPEEVQKLEEQLSKASTEYRSIMAKAQAENRAMNAEETGALDRLQGEIAGIESKLRLETTAAAVKKALDERSAAAARVVADSTLNLNKGEYLRSIAKGNQNVGNLEVTADVVRQFNESSPLFQAHKNVQKRTTGNSFEFTKVISGGAGYAKNEGSAGTTDNSSTITMGVCAYKTYSGQKILATQEMLDDAAVDVAQEVTTLGLAQAIHAFAVDAVTAMKSQFLVSTTFTPTETAATAWALQDIIDAWYEIPIRNRSAVKFMAKGSTLKALVGLLTNVNAPQAAAINFSPENFIEDDAFDADVLFLGDPTKILAIGFKQPVRVFAQDISEGKTFEAQPRLAVALRDGTAVSCRKLKAA